MSVLLTKGIEFPPCELICKPIGADFIATRAPTVVDGTMCTIYTLYGISTSAICIQGECTVSDKTVSVVVVFTFALFFIM